MRCKPIQAKGVGRAQAAQAALGEGAGMADPCILHRLLGREFAEAINRVAACKTGHATCLMVAWDLGLVELISHVQRSCEG